MTITGLSRQLLTVDKLIYICYIRGHTQPIALTMTFSLGRRRLYP